MTPPKVERATEMGMIHAMTPSSFSPNVWERAKEGGGRREEDGRVENERRMVGGYRDYSPTKLDEGSWTEG